MCGHKVKLPGWRMPSTAMTLSVSRHTISRLRLTATHSACLDFLLMEHLLPAIKEASGEYFTFQQDSAPAHRAHETVALLKRETPDFITPLLWPPNSPDLNPVDYKVWSVLQERVYQTRIRDVSHLKERLVEEWDKFDQSIVDRAVKQWRQRLKACVRADGGHFEHQL